MESKHILSKIGNKLEVIVIFLRGTSFPSISKHSKTPQSQIPFTAKLNDGKESAIYECPEF